MGSCGIVYRDKSPQCRAKIIAGNNRGVRKVGTWQKKLKTKMAKSQDYMLKKTGQTAFM